MPHESNSDDWSPTGKRSRRRVLKLAGIVGATGFAGCQTATPGQNSDENPETTPDSRGETPTVEIPDERPLEAWERYNPDWEAPTTSPLDAEFETEVLVENLEIPWDLSFAPDGSLFITERVGTVLRFDGDEVRTVAKPQEAIDAGSVEPGSDESSWWVKGGEGGTLGVAVHPDYPDPAHVFVYYTYRDENDERFNKVDVFDVDSDDPGTPIRTVVDGIPADNYHNGGRITFGPRNYLWVTCGDGGQPAKAQDPASFAGKILRLTAAGDPAPGNPTYDDPDADRRVYTLGHRNPQGIVWLPDGTTLCSEHGQSGDDEINRLEAGANYGWAEEGERVREREQYPGSDVHKPLYGSGNDSFAPTGSLFYTGDAVPALRNRMLIGGLISQQLVVATLTPPGEQLPPSDDAYEQVVDADWTDDAYGVTIHELFTNEFGRIRHVEQGPDGELYLITSNRDGRASEQFPRERDDVLLRISQQ